MAGDIALSILRRLIDAGVAVLDLNEEERVRLRRSLMAEGIFP